MNFGVINEGSLIDELTESLIEEETESVEQPQDDDDYEPFARQSSKGKANKRLHNRY